MVKHHGVPFLEKKQLELAVNKSNKNDIRKILGNPSTKSKFDNDVWIYIERKQTQSKLKNLGQMKIYKNDILVLEIDKYGMLKKKSFYDLNDMNDLKIITLSYTFFEQNENNEDIQQDSSVDLLNNMLLKSSYLRLKELDNG